MDTDDARVVPCRSRHHGLAEKLKMNKSRRYLASCGATLVVLVAVAPGVVVGSLDGRWLSEGYGYLAEIQSGEMRLFEVGPSSCLPSDTFRLTSGTRFVSGSGSRSFVLSPGPEPDSEWFRAPGAASSILFRRTAARPKLCAARTPNDPVTSFEVLASTFAAHHGFLKHRGVDWSAVTKTYRARVGPATPREELFEVFRAMIEPLHDMHTFIEALDIKRVFNGKRPGTLLLTDAEKERTIEILETRYLAGRLRSWCNGHLRYGRTKAGVGYLRIDSFYGYTKTGRVDDDVRALDAALDEVLKDARALPGLVIDVRINRGGNDAYGIQVAGRLTDKPYVAFVKRARNDAQDPESWTAPQPSTVHATARPRFLGNVVELIGPDTVSAGETFTMALMGRQPHVTRIGEDTQGVYSDPLVRLLPNGWRFALPNEVFLTEDGRHYEAGGVPPDAHVPVFSKTDLADGRDAGLEAALALLQTVRARAAPRAVRSGPTAR